MTSPTKHRTLSIGGATYDLFARTLEPVQKIESGSKVRIAEVVECCGGGAANTAVGLKRLQCDASFEGVLADDAWGKKIQEHLKQEGVKTDMAMVVEGETASFSMILAVEGGDRIIFYTPGTNVHLHAENFDRDIAKTADWIYLNSLQERSCDLEDDLITMLAAVQGPGLTWNPGGCHIDRGIKDTRIASLLRNTDILLLNREEALAFTHTDSPEAALRALIDAGVHVVCITDGRNGSLASDGSSLYHCGTLPDPVVEATGAGDAFGTGFTWATLEGLNLPNRLRAGTINAASVIGATGAQALLLTDIEMRTRLEHVHLDVIVTPLHS